jgi:HEAT repeat protein
VLLKIMRDQTDPATGRGKDKGWKARYDAALAYAKLPDFRIQDVLPLLQSDNYETRAVAVFALGGGGKDAVPVLLDRMASDPHGFVRAFCASVLGEIGDPRAFQPLLDMAAKRDTHWRARESAVAALGKFHDSRATSVLTQIIEDSFQRPAIGSWATTHAVESLAMIGDSQCVQVLAKMAEHTWPRGVGDLTATSQHAAQLIATVTNPAAEEELGKLAMREESSWVAMSATEALGHFQTDRAAAILEEVVERFKTSGRRAEQALFSLGSTGTARACKTLWKTVLDQKEDRATRSAACGALSRFDEKLFVPFVLSEWRDVGRETDLETIFIVAAALEGHSDARLIPLWLDVFGRAAPLVRLQRGWDGNGWHFRGAPGMDYQALSRFLHGMRRIGKPGLDDLRRLRDTEQEPRLRQLISRAIEEIESGKAGQQVR